MHVIVTSHVSQKKFCGFLEPYDFVNYDAPLAVIFAYQATLSYRLAVHILKPMTPEIVFTLAVI